LARIIKAAAGVYIYLAADATVVRKTRAKKPRALA
jgi:hypothetical protein